MKAQALVIENYDDGAGFFATVNDVLNYAIWADHFKLVPLLHYANPHYGRSATNDTGEIVDVDAPVKEKKTADFWTEYFEPLVGVSQEDYPCCKEDMKMYEMPTLAHFSKGPESDVEMAALKEAQTTPPFDGMCCAVRGC
jgi:hypothetical protein